VAGLIIERLISITSLALLSDSPAMNACLENSLGKTKKR